MARYQIILAYDGTSFYGSQRQRQTRTVQSELEKALIRIGWKGKSILLAGRTDTGVHASGQVAAFDLEWGHNLDDLQKALNANLATDLAVRKVSQAASSFHPRFHATSRRYRYRLYCQEVRDPLRDRYGWQVWPPISDPTALASFWLGRHDFSAFGSPTTPKGSTVRMILYAGWQRKGDEWTFEIEGDAFLYRMVRRIVYVQVAVSQGRAEVEDLVLALDSNVDVREAAKNRIPAGLALPNGLTLIEVKYDNLA
jgi:tRNA pseudouridine38-40 synthase